MEFVQKAKGYSEKEEEDEEDDEGEEIGNFACNFTPRHQISRSHSHQPLTATEAIDFHGKLQLMDLSLRIDSTGGGGGGGGGSSNGGFIEREHMFDKVVTPSDVGKLNRLVIPKQYAEKFFPLDSSTNEKGLILNFEDRNGKPWRFRYSYWNSSQSYVMTKGWSRFVKEKKLDAGDIVSFGRGAREFEKDRLFIDWRRRPDAPPSNPLLLRSQVIYTQPSPTNPLLLRHYTAGPPPRLYHHHHWQHMNYNNVYQNYISDISNLGTSNSVYCLRPSMCNYKMGENEGSSMADDSVPVVCNGNKTSTKRLRLFGVNMECSATKEEDPSNAAIETDQFSRRGKKPSSFNYQTS